MKLTSIVARLLATVTVLLSTCVVTFAQSTTGVLTYHNDYYRTGSNTNEAILSPGTLLSAGNNFGVIATVNTLDNTVAGQPLIVPGLQVSCPQNQTIVTCQPNLSGSHDVVFVSTISNTIYAIDASNGQILLQRNLGAKSGYCGGIKSTPVIDPTTGRLYVIAHTVVNNAQVHILHAINVWNLMDSVTPFTISPSNTFRAISDGTAYGFDSTVTCQKTALLLLGGRVYAGFSGKEYGVGSPPVLAASGRGWVLSWNASTLAPLTPLLTDRIATSTNTYFLSSLWMSGAGIASDGASLYFATGNSDPSGTSYNPTINIEESVVKLTPNMSVASVFTPSNYAALDATDGDLGSGGVLVIPTSPALVVAGGKDGRMFLLNGSSLGGYTAGGPDNYLDMHPLGGCWCTPSFFMGPDGVGRVVSSGGNSLITWTLTQNPATGTPNLVQEGSAQIAASIQDPGFFTSISSNGNGADGSRIIWAVGRPVDSSKSLTLYAFGAVPVAGALPLLGQYTAGTWTDGGDANIVPVVANGKVYVSGTGGAGAGMLTILGFNAQSETSSKKQ